jgi:hypothetical protein
MNATSLHMQWGMGSDGRPALHWRSGDPRSAMILEQPPVPATAGGSGGAGGTSIGAVFAATSVRFGAVSRRSECMLMFDAPGGR